MEGLQGNTYFVSDPPSAGVQSVQNHVKPNFVDCSFQSPSGRAEISKLCSFHAHFSFRMDSRDVPDVLISEVFSDVHKNCMGTHNDLPTVGIGIGGSGDLEDFECGVMRLYRAWKC